MTIAMSLRIALKALGRNKLRTTLTMLGMIIGVAAVLTMFALGSGAQASVAQEVRSSGTNLIHINAGNYTRGGDDVNIPAGRGASTKLSTTDADAIRDEIEGVTHLSAGVTDRTQMIAGASKFFGKAIGVDVEFPELYSWSMQEGEFFSAGDVSGSRAVVVLGSVVKDKLFGPEAEAVGQQVQLWNQPFEVVGVTNSTTDDQEESVFVPYTTAQSMLQITHLHSISVAAESAGVTTRMSDDITNLLRDRHGLNAEEEALKAAQGDVSGALPSQILAEGAETADMTNTGDEGIIIRQPPPRRLVADDFTVRTQAAQALTKGLYTSAAAFILANLPQLDDVTLDELANTLDQANTTMTALLASIAGVSLIVGGIGIMNIMLVSVTERTREIGIRMAVGARGGDVLLQFLVEAVTLSLFGGIVGIALGFAASDLVTRMLEWPTQISASAIALAFGIAAAIGVFFGFYPARKASMLDPIDALRYE